MIGLVCRVSFGILSQVMHLNLEGIHDNATTGNKGEFLSLS